MKWMNLPIVCLVFGLLSCSPFSQEDQQLFDQAENNAVVANEGYQRCLNFVTDWLSFADPQTGLIPENLDRGIDIWSPHNSAADNYPFMVLTAMLLNQELFDNEMLQILQTETKLTSRLGALPDNYSFSNQDFQRANIDTAAIIFATSEYIKDGLIPLTEYAGDTPWSKRMLNMLNDLHTLLMDQDTYPGVYHSNWAAPEVNGELLQTLSRVYWMTGDEKFRNWAEAIADYYMILHPEFLLQSNRLRLRDHGCEIIAGLSEFYVIAHYKQLDNKPIYQEYLHLLLDRILEVGRNQDGMLYNAVNMITGEPAEQSIVDNWGYVYNAFYTVYLIDQHQPYREAVRHAFTKLNLNYHNYNWESGSSDGFADAIEGGINLFNREPDPELEQWIDAEMKIMWSLQDSSYRSNAQQWKNRGVIEGWHGDGNFARTALMYCLWKTAGTTIHPWRADVQIGAIRQGDQLFISLTAGADWEGKLHFGSQRHVELFNMPMDYPRINQFPEWYPVLDKVNYTLSSSESGKAKKFSGKKLKEGIPIRIKKGSSLQFKLK